MGFYLDAIGNNDPVLEYSKHYFTDKYSRREKQVLYKPPLPGKKLLIGAI